jgi:hypothetical protein
LPGNIIRFPTTFPGFLFRSYSLAGLFALCHKPSWPKHIIFSLRSLATLMLHLQSRCPERIGLRCALGV